MNNWRCGKCDGGNFPKHSLHCDKRTTKKREGNKFEIKIIEMPKGHDSNAVYFYQNGNRVSGFAYQSKENKSFHIVKCPNCYTENYAPQMAVGLCYKCGFNI